MLFDSYTISFCPGSSGRLIHTVLYNMIMGNDIVFNFTENNAAHDTNVEMSMAVEDIHATNIFQIITFNDNVAKILHTHRFPDIDIVRERFKYKMGIIVIAIKPIDLPEIVYNSFLKNKKIELTEPTVRTIAKLKIKQWKDFIDISSLSGQSDVLILEYSKLFDLHEGEYTTLKKIEQFTGLRCTSGLTKSFENYTMGRKKLIDSKMPWLYELQQNLDK